MQELENLIKRYRIKKADEVPRNGLINSFIKQDSHAYYTYKKHHNLQSLLVREKFLKKKYTDAQL